MNQNKFLLGLDQNGVWVGPWCSRYVLIVKDKSTIVDEKHEYRRHVFKNGVFKTERIRVEKWWELGYDYNDLPDDILTE